MRWDIFCKVIDNWGDAGVCWRLACELAAHGDAVRLWIDDVAPLAWMAPAGCPGVAVVPWADAQAAADAARAAPPDVLIEAFGCEPDAEALARFAAQVIASRPNVRQAVEHGLLVAAGERLPVDTPRWINLEYLSAEPQVERLHRLPSPVFSGPGAGLTKHFFYPGFTSGTGGLLREGGLEARQAAFDRADWLYQHGVEWHGDRLISLFCYEPPALASRPHMRQAVEHGLLVAAGERLPVDTPRWINLEYLSAEPQVERLHRLPSPVFSGPGAGLTKHFFYPGFTSGTGGLLREGGLEARQAAFDRAGWLYQHGVEWHGDRLISLFCYEPPALASLLANLRDTPPTTCLLATAGRSTAAVQSLIDTVPGAGVSRRGGVLRRSDSQSALSITYLPHLTSIDFDHLLWACDLNFVRGEDSLGRALWAGAPFVWQLYPQHDDAHHAKLEALLDWLAAPASLRRMHRAWNGVSQEPLPRIDADLLAEWRGVAQAARARLLAQDDLATQLRRFVGRPASR